MSDSTEQAQTTEQSPEVVSGAEQVVQVLREKTTRRGATKRFDVVAVGHTQAEALQGIQAGRYTILSGSAVANVEVSYREVQDVTTL